MSHLTLLLFITTIFTSMSSSSGFPFFNYYTTRIVGGEEVTPHKYPWVVYMAKVSSPKAFCGGTILDREWIMTAAHCLSKLEGDDEWNPHVLKIVAGAHKQLVPEESQQFVSVIKVIIHPNFTELPKMENDIALLKVVPKLQFDTYVQPVPYAGNDFDEIDFTDNMAIVAGWGLTQENNLFSDSPTLKSAKLEFVSNEDCHEIYKDDTEVRSSHMCALDAIPDEYGRNGACKGDSGGSLMCRSRDGKVTVACGIVSFGSECGHPEYPTVFTRVSSYSDFIFEKTGIFPYPFSSNSLSNVNSAHIYYSTLTLMVLTHLLLASFSFYYKQVY